MLNRIKALFADVGTTQGGAVERYPGDQLQLAAAALLVEAASMDDHFEDRERRKIAELLRARFGLSEAETEALLEDAQQRVAESSQLFAFTRVIKDRFSHEDRVGLMEMLWQVAYVDGELHDYEASLMRRIAGLIFVSDRESGDARKRALQRLGLDGEDGGA